MRPRCRAILLLLLLLALVGALVLDAQRRGRVGPPLAYDVLDVLLVARVQLHVAVHVQHLGRVRHRVGFGVRARVRARARVRSACVARRWASRSRAAARNAASATHPSWCAAAAGSSARPGGHIIEGIVKVKCYPHCARWLPF